MAVGRHRLEWCHQVLARAGSTVPPGPGCRKDLNYLSGFMKTWLQRVSKGPTLSVSLVPRLWPSPPKTMGDCLHLPRVKDVFYLKLFYHICQVTSYAKRTTVAAVIYAFWRLTDISVLVLTACLCNQKRRSVWQVINWSITDPNGITNLLCVLDFVNFLL